MAKEKRRYFVTGLLIVLPVLITVYLFISLFLFFDNILGRYLSRITLAYLGFKIPGLGLLLFVLLVFGAGFFATNFVGRRLLHYLENIWFKFPFVKKIYPAAKQVTKFLFSGKLEGQIQKVVLLEYPSPGIYSYGFVTNQAEEEVRQKVREEELVNVLVPSVPNPLTGMLVIVPRRKLIFLDMGVEDAVKIIVSGGVLSLDDLSGSSAGSVLDVK